MMGPTQGVFADDRGQTLQDYALGIGIFLLALFFVLSVVVPSMLAPFHSDSGGDVEAQAERIAERLVENATDGDRRNEMNISKVSAIAGSDQAALQDRYRLPETSQVNVTIETLNGSSTALSATGTRLAAGGTPRTAEMAVRSRIVTLSDGSCDPACRLVVRVW